MEETTMTMTLAMDFRTRYKADWMADVDLRSDEERKWEAVGLRGAAVQVLADIKAAHRAKQRENAAIFAAATWVDERVPDIQEEWVYVACMQACLHADTITVGGHSPRPRHGDNDGGRSKRFPAFAGCGKGRRYASDGQAWTAALAAAAWRLQQDTGVSLAGFSTDGSTLSAEVWVGNEHRTVPIDGLFTDEWVCAVAARCLAAYTRNGATPEALCWGEFYNVAVARFLSGGEDAEDDG
jgi:hypothetical protein